MSDFQINPPGVEREYLECLNAAFGHWGNARQFDWYFRRETSFPATDLLVFRESGKLAAGSGITYRQVRLPDNGAAEETSVGIMTGSWTLPEYRGRGFFSRMIEASMQRAASKNTQLLLAFVKADNASCRQLQKFGALLFPSFYLFSTESTPLPKIDLPLERITPEKKIVVEIFEKFAASAEGFARYAYPSARDFRAQFLERPHETEILSNRCHRSFAVIEKKGEINLLQLQLSPDKNDFTAALLARSLGENRKFFVFTMRKEEADTLGKNFGLVIKEGFLAVLPARTNVRLKDKLKWKIQGGDRT